MKRKGYLYYGFTLVLGIVYLLSYTSYFLALFFFLLFMSWLSLLCMFICAKKVKFKWLLEGSNVYLQYIYKHLLLIGNIKVHIVFYNVFLNEKEVFEVYFCPDCGEMKKISSNLKLGVHEFETCYFVVEDMLALFSMKVKMDSVSPFCVYPLLKDVEIASFKSDTQDTESDEYELRPYRENDHLKKLHYKMSYKMQTLIVKEIRKEEHALSVFVDLNVAEEKCVQVFSYLHAFLKQLQDEYCMLYFYTDQSLVELDKVNISNEFYIFKQILSNQKAQTNQRLNTTFYIGENGVQGGESYA